MKDNHLLKKQIQILKDPKWIILLFAIIFFDRHIASVLSQL